MVWFKVLTKPYFCFDFGLGCPNKYQLFLANHPLVRDQPGDIEGGDLSGGDLRGGVFGGSGGLNLI